MHLDPYLNAECVLIIERPADKADVLRRLAACAAPSAGVDADELLTHFTAREQQMPTSTPEGVGLPHALMPGVEKTLVVPALLKPGVSFGSADHPPVDIIFAMIGPAEKPWEHLRILARLARLARLESTRRRLREADSPEALYRAIVEEDAAHE